MTGSSRVAYAVALGLALCLGAGATSLAFAPAAIHAPVAGSGLRYDRIFDLDHLRGNFALSNRAVLPPTDIVVDTVFGIDVQLPVSARAVSRPTFERRASNPTLGLVQLQLGDDAAQVEGAFVPGLALRLHDAQFKLQYEAIGTGGVSDLAFADSSGAAPVLAALQPTTTFFSSDANASHGGLLNPATFSNARGGFAPTGLPFADPGGAFGDRSVTRYSPFVPDRENISSEVTAPVQFGGVRLTGHIASAHFEGNARPSSLETLQRCGSADPNASCASFTDAPTVENGLAAGTNFNLRTGTSRIAVDLSGTYEHLSPSSQSAFPYVPGQPQAGSFDAKMVLPEAQTPALFYPNLLDVEKSGVNANVALPISGRLTLNLGYNAQHYSGTYGTDLEQIDAHKDAYLGNITYKIPNTNSAITFSAGQFRYLDGFTPLNNTTQTRANLNFTVKF